MNLLRKEHYINGAWHKSAETYAVRNPATGEVIADVAKAGAAQAAATSAAKSEAVTYFANISLATLPGFAESMLVTSAQAV